jgi:hypothetical protein
MNALENYLEELSAIRNSGGAVKETSYYPALSNLLNEVGKTLKPRVRCIINIQNAGAGLPDGGLYAAEQFQKQAKGVNFAKANCRRAAPLRSSQQAKK